jgi:hypothetical protein
MRHGTRIRRLERAVEARRPPPTCPACGGPRPGYNALVLVVDENAPPEPRCAECGLIIDTEGRARSALPLPDHPVAIRRIVLEAS